MSSYPQHEQNVKEIKELDINVSALSIDDDPYDSWDYDTLTELTSELLGEIRALKSQLINTTIATERA